MFKKWLSQELVSLLRLPLLVDGFVVKEHVTTPPGPLLRATAPLLVLPETCTLTLRSVEIAGLALRLPITKMILV